MKSWGIVAAAAILGPLLALGGYILHDSNKQSKLKEYREAVELFVMKSRNDSLPAAGAKEESQKRADLYLRLRDLAFATGMPGPEEIREGLDK